MRAAGGLFPHNNADAKRIAPRRRMLYSLSLYNFRNLQNKTIDLSAKEVFFIGENGQGKSNLLESIYYSAYGASFRTRNDLEIIKAGEAEMRVRALFNTRTATGNEAHTTFISVKERSKRIERDGKFIRDRKELINTIPCVLYDHDDLDFAQGAPERRRFFLDQCLSMYDAVYIDALRRYKRILKNRNLCLKERESPLLETYDLELAEAGLALQKKRKDVVFAFNRIFADLYEKVSGIPNVRVRYLPSWRDDAGEVSKAFVLAYLKKTAPQERLAGASLSGPHRDRVIFEKDGAPFVRRASLGQTRLLALALRTAQAVFYTSLTARLPLLLMDDVLLELDPEKRQKFISLLPEYDQLFCAFLPGEPFRAYLRRGSATYRIQNGDWRALP